jgi:hypothetical protein
MSTAYVAIMDSNSDTVSQIQTLIEKLDKLPDPHPVYPNWYHASTVIKINSIKTSLTVIIERAYAKSTMRDSLLGQLKGISVHEVNFTDNQGKGVDAEEFDGAKILLTDLMYDIQKDLSGGNPPKTESSKPTVSNIIINQQTTTIDIIRLLEKAVESEPISKDQKKTALQKINDLKNDPVLSKLIATGITQLAPKAMEWIAGSPGK